MIWRENSNLVFLLLQWLRWRDKVRFWVCLGEVNNTEGVPNLTDWCLNSLDRNSVDLRFEHQGDTCHCVQCLAHSWRWRRLWDSGLKRSGYLFQLLA